MQLPKPDSMARSIVGRQDLNMCKQRHNRMMRLRGAGLQQRYVEEDTENKVGKTRWTRKRARTTNGQACKYKRDENAVICMGDE